MKFIKPGELLTNNSVCLLLYLTHLVLNLLESPLLVPFYYLEVVFFLYLGFKKNWRDLLYPTLVFFFIEGQGRVLTGYNPLMRNIFDVYLIVILIKSIISDRKIIDLKAVPISFNILIILHFVWYIVQIFNFQNLGSMAVIFAAKIYILPLLFFHLFLREKLDIRKYGQTRLFLFLTILIGGQVILIFHQMGLQEQHLLNISPYYRKIMSERFIGLLFRPFGTSFVPGGISVHFAYITALLLIVKPKLRLFSLVKLILIASMIFACFTMQVRTSLIQLALIVFFSYVALSFVSRLRFILIPIIMSFLFLIPIALESSSHLAEIFPNLNLDYAIRRIQVLRNIDDIQVQRASFSKFFDTLTDRLDKTPLGLGPGRTGAANSMFVDRIKADILFGIDYSWTLDNLFISLAIDFGWGMIFYSLLVIGLPIYIILRTLYFSYRNRTFYQTPTVLGITVFVILLSNWGAIAIPYNPVSFFFWFYCAIALLEIKRIQGSSQTLKAHQ